MGRHLTWVDAWPLWTQSPTTQFPNQLLPLPALQSPAGASHWLHPVRSQRARTPARRSTQMGLLGARGGEGRQGPTGSQRARPTACVSHSLQADELPSDCTRPALPPLELFHMLHAASPLSVPTHGKSGRPTWMSSRPWHLPSSLTQKQSLCSLDYQSVSCEDFYNSLRVCLMSLSLLDISIFFNLFTCLL